MHLFQWAEDSRDELLAELTRIAPGSRPELVHGSMFKAGFSLQRPDLATGLVFARQVLPNAQLVQAPSIREWANAILDAVLPLPEDQPWALHIFPYYAAPIAHRMGARAWHTARHRVPAAREEENSMPAHAGEQRCGLIEQAVRELLKRKRRHLLRQLLPNGAPFTPRESLVQVALVEPATGYISSLAAPQPYELRKLVAAFPAGRVVIPSDKAAPSRAFAKLVEAEQRLGRSIQSGQTCVDLGAAPGSWTYVARARGARVVAVDRSPLREDLMNTELIEFRRGDAFAYEPPVPVDWLLCDVIVEPERGAELLISWLKRRWCRQFVFTLKLGAQPPGDLLGRLKQVLPTAASEVCLQRLNANKKEICAFGWL